MNRPAFKNSELDPIPADWEVKRLGEIASVITKGTTPTSIGCEFERYGINFIKAESISDNGVFIAKMFAHISERTNMLLSRSVLKAGDYLFSIAGVLGRVALVPENVLPANTNQALAIIRLAEKSQIDRKYLFFTLQSAYIKNRIQGTNVAAAQANLSLQDVSDFHVAFPPLFEQRCIAAALSDVDAWIESLDKLIEKKKLLKQGAMQALLSGKTRLPGFSGEWVEKRLGDCMIVNPPNDRMLPETFFYIDLESVTKGRLADVSEIQKVTAPSRAQRLFQKGDILFQTVRPYQNNNLFVDFDANQFVASTGYAILRAKSDTDARWVFEIIQTQQFTDHVMDHCTGTGYPAINPGKLAEIPFLMPLSIAEQRAIAEVLSDMDAELAALSREKAKAEQIKQGMMQELLTGRTRLGGGERSNHVV